MADDVLKAGLVDRELEVSAVPRIDAGLVEVDDGDLDVGALEGDDSARRATYGRSSCHHVKKLARVLLKSALLTDVSGTDCERTEAVSILKHIRGIRYTTYCSRFW